MGCLSCSACRFLSRLADFKDAVQNNEICWFYIICPKRFTYKPRTLSLDLFSRLTSTDISQVRPSATETVTRFRFSLLSLLIFSMDVRHLQSSAFILSQESGLEERGGGRGSDINVL